jgi:death-on-curing protein
MFYLTTDDVVELYLRHVGDASALTRLDLLESAVALPQASMFGEDLYPDVYLKAAALLRSIAQNQAFLDGNKRIAWITTRVFLAANGVVVRTTTEDGLNLMISLAEGRIDVDGIAAFLAENAGIPTDDEDTAS